GRADDAVAAVGDVRLGVELLGLVHANLDLARANTVDHAFHPGEERVSALSLYLDRGVKRGGDCIGSGTAGFASDQQADSIDFLPGAVQGEEGADFKMARGYVDRFAQVAPLTHILERLPLLGGVVDDEAVRCCHLYVSRSHPRCPG